MLSDDVKAAPLGNYLKNKPGVLKAHCEALPSTYRADQRQALVFRAVGIIDEQDTGE